MKQQMGPILSLAVYLAFQPTWAGANPGFPGGQQVAERADTSEAGLWEGMKKENREYDWLRPPDGVFQNAIDQVFDGKASAFPAYTFQCGEMLGCRRKFRFGKKRSLARVTLATPVRLVVEDVSNPGSNRAGAPPAPEEIASRRAVFAVSLLIQAKKKADKPSITVQAGERMLVSQETRVGVRRIERCWVDRGEKCWRSLYTVFFAVEENVSLTGSGQIQVQWAKGEIEVPIDFDYLW